MTMATPARPRRPSCCCPMAATSVARLASLLLELALVRAVAHHDVDGEGCLQPGLATRARPEPPSPHEGRKADARGWMTMYVLSVVWMDAAARAAVALSVPQKARTCRSVGLCKQETPDDKAETSNFAATRFPLFR